MHWDDIQYFLALARQGSLTAAARTLGVNHATVSRRVASLEGDLDGALFSRTAEGFVLTSLGETLLGPAEEVESRIRAFERARRNADPNLSGTLRITTPQLFSSEFLAPAVMALREEHPAIDVLLIEDTRFLSLTKLEADIALRFVFPGTEHGTDSLRVRQLGEFSWVFAATKEFCDIWNIGEQLTTVEQIPVAVYHDVAPGPVGNDWLRDFPGEPRIAVRTGSMYTTMAQIGAHRVTGCIPEFAARSIGARAISPPVEVSRLLLTIHPETQHNARIRTVFDFLVEWWDREFSEADG